MKAADKAVRGLFVTCFRKGAYYVMCGGPSHAVLRAGKEDSVMNLDLFDDMEGIILHEREAALDISDMNKNSGNDSIPRFPVNTPLAMAYVPFQQWGETYGDDEALSRGTLFPELDLPFAKGGNGK